jgi:hypothetical protein
VVQGGINLTLRLKQEKACHPFLALRVTVSAWLYLIIQEDPQAIELRRQAGEDDTGSSWSFIGSSLQTGFRYGEGICVELGGVNARGATTKLFPSKPGCDENDDILTPMESDQTMTEKAPVNESAA